MKVDLLETWTENRFTTQNYSDDAWHKYSQQRANAIDFLSSSTTLAIISHGKNILEYKMFKITLESKETKFSQFWNNFGNKERKFEQVQMKSMLSQNSNFQLSTVSSSATKYIMQNEAT